MLFLACLMLGLIAVARMPIALFPSMSGDQITVVFQRPSSSPEFLEREILNKLESRIGSVPDIEETAGEIRGSGGRLQIQFEKGTDIKVREYEIRRIAAKLQREQPRNTTYINVRTQDTSRLDRFVMDISIVGGNQDTDVLFDIASDLIAPRLASVPGVAQATATGGGGRQVIVEVDPLKASLLGVETNRISSSIEARGGSLNYMGSLEDETGRTPVLVDGRLKTLATLERTGVSANSPAELKHTSDVHFGYAKADAFYRVNGQQAVGIAVYQESNANLVELGNLLRERIEEIRREVSSMGIDLVVLQDSSQDVKDQLERLLALGSLGIAIALVVLFAILRQWRAVLVVGISVPVSIVLALALLYLFGFGINLLTLFGLAVSTGLLVDNSVVVYEAILRGVERNVPISESVTRGLRRTIRAICAASLTTAIVFLPVLLVDIENTFMEEFIKIIAASLLLPIGTSLFVAIGLVPLLAHRLAAPAARARADRLHLERRKRGGFVEPNVARTFLVGLVKNALRHPASWLTGVVIVVVLTLFFAWIPLLSGGGQEQATRATNVDVNLRFSRGGRSLDSAETTMTRIEAELMGIEGVKTVVVNGDREGAQVNVQLEDYEDRPKEVTPGFIRSHVQAHAKKTTGLEAMRSGDQDYDGDKRDAQRRFSGGAPGRFVLSGPDSQELYRIAENLASRLEGADYVGGAWVAVPRGGPEIWVTPNQSVLDSLGLRLTDVMRNLNLAGSEGVTLSTNYTLASGREIPIVIQRTGLDKEMASLNDLRKLRVTTPAGAIRLDTVATPRRMRSSAVIVHKNGRREMAVNYRFERNAPRTGAARESLNMQIADMARQIPLPPEYTIERISDDEDTSAVGTLVVFAALFLFLVLAMTFESLSLPALVMMSLPLTMLGSGWVLYLAGKSMEPGVLVGILALVGITVNPAILLVDRMQRKIIDAGWSRGAAALATVRERTRPVLLVTATTIAALTPLAVSTGRENEVWPGFAMTVIGGLVSSALLTLLVIPVGYILLQRLDHIFGRVGPWLMVGWGAATIAIMAWLIGSEQLESMFWQFVVSLLVGGGLLALVVMVFRQQEPPVPYTDGGPPVLEVKHLGKIYDVPGPFTNSIEKRKSYIRRVIQTGGEIFSKRESLEKTGVLLVIAIGFAAVSYLTIDSRWGLITALGVCACVALTVFELRRLFGYVDQEGAVLPSHLISAMVYLLPWLVIGLNIYWVNVLPSLAGEHPEIPLLWPIVVGLVLLIAQSLRWSAVRQVTGAVKERAQGFLRHPRTFMRTWSRRIAGFDLPQEEVVAISAVAFSAKRGMIGILGPNGAGKTTLLRQLAGILDPTSGVITLGGVPIKFLRKHLARWIGYLPQDSGLPEGSTPRAYLMYYAGLYEIEPELRDERVRSLLEEVGLDGKESDKIGSLSGGMRQRVAVARTLLRLPPIIIVDEPTVGLDPRERIRFRNLLSRLAQNRIVLFSTHVVDDVAVACDRVLVLANKKLMFDGAPGELSTHANGLVWQTEQPASETFELPTDGILVDEIPAGDGKIRRRILSRQAPASDANAMQSNLEDGYLWLIGEVA